MKQKEENVSMRRKNITNEIIRESITEALLLLMNSKPFGQITITEIVKKAGVSRVSFYRNYESKEDVLVSYLDDAAMRWWKNFPKSGGDYALGFFEHCQSLKEIIALLYKQGLATLSWQNLRNLLGPNEGDNEVMAYRKSCLVGCIFGVMSEWVHRGMTETPENMDQILRASQIDVLIGELYETAADFNA